MRFVHGLHFLFQKILKEVLHWYFKISLYSWGQVLEFISCNYQSLSCYFSYCIIFSHFVLSIYIFSCSQMLFFVQLNSSETRKVLERLIYYIIYKVKSWLPIILTLILLVFYFLCLFYTEIYMFIILVIHTFCILTRIIQHIPRCAHIKFGMWQENGRRD